MERANEVIEALQALASKQYEEVFIRFFKTAPGEYGEGDHFLGIRVPQIRKVAKEAQALKLNEIQHLINSPLHEVRECGFFILVLLLPCFRSIMLLERGEQSAADEQMLLAVGERGGVGLVVVGLDRASHLVKGRFDALDVVVELDDAGELPLVLGFEVGGDEPDDTQVRQLVELGTKRGTFGVIEQQRIDYQDIRTQCVDSGIQGAQIIR